MLTASLTNVLILNDDTLTPWTNTTLVGVPGWSSINNNSNYLPAILSSASVAQFADSINSMKFNFSFDYAVAILKLENF